MWNDREQIGEIGVDAGIVWIGDPCYIIHQKPDKEFGKDWLGFVDKLDGQVTKFRLGLCVSTPDGDGTFPVFVERDDRGRVSKIIIDFDSRDEEER